VRRALGPPGIVDGYEHRCRKVRLIEHADIRALGRLRAPSRRVLLRLVAREAGGGRGDRTALIRTLDVEAEIERELRLRSDSGFTSASDTLRSVLS
jgi:hypothetical protein